MLNRHKERGRKYFNSHLYWRKNRSIADEIKRSAPMMMKKARRRSFGFHHSANNVVVVVSIEMMTADAENKICFFPYKKL